MRAPAPCVALVLLCALAASPAMGGRDGTIRHPFLAEQADKAPEEAVLAVEIPAGSFTKYGINDEGLAFVGRFQSMPVACPANDGSLPHTLAGTDDPPGAGRPRSGATAS
ncbi:MAG: hypothetical protein KIS72_04530 [Luteimonas sp.]|nr:hypothetical protein [Luteimonas sp.]